MGMKATGIVRNIDNLGRITVPKEIRKKYDMTEETPMEMFVDDDGLYFKIYRPSCYFCGEPTKEVVLGKRVCEVCRERLRKDLVGE